MPSDGDVRAFLNAKQARVFGVARAAASSQVAPVPGSSETHGDYVIDFFGSAPTGAARLLAKDDVTQPVPTLRAPQHFSAFPLSAASARSFRNGSVTPSAQPDSRALEKRLLPSSDLRPSHDAEMRMSYRAGRHRRITRCRLCEESHANCFPKETLLDHGREKPEKHPEPAEADARMFGSLERREEQKDQRQDGDEKLSGDHVPSLPPTP